MRKLFITHNDLDAIGCMVVAKIYDQKFDAILCMNYDEYENKKFNYDLLSRYDEIVYADFSPDIDSLLILYDNKVKVTIYDHHESFKKLYDDIIDNKIEYVSPSVLLQNFTYIYDNNKCGTCIYFEALKGNRTMNSLVEFVELVDTYDMWRWQDQLFDTAVSLNRIIWKYMNWRRDGYGKYEKVVKIFINRIVNNNSFGFTEDEKDYIIEALLKEKTILHDARKNLLVRTDERGHKFGMTRLSKKVSFTLFNLMKMRSDLDYIIGINTYNENKGELKISIRSLDKFNCLDLQYAQGHRNACGTDGTDTKFINDLWYGRVYELGYKVEDNKSSS